MEILQSKIIELPVVYFISDINEIKDLPIGLPYIVGDKKNKHYIVRLLEYEVLYESFLSLGYSIKFDKYLEEKFYKDLTKFWWSNPPKVNIVNSGTVEEDEELTDSVEHTPVEYSLKDFIKDSTCRVHIEKLKELRIFPVWLEKLEDAVSENITTYSMYNPNLYNKKLDGMYGSIDVVNPKKNLIIIDISGSIPKAISATCLTLAKNLVETFHADLLITGSKSTLYEYQHIKHLDLDGIYIENGMDNDQIYFRNLITKEQRKYDTAIIFGDNHQPGQKWSNEYNRRTVEISQKTGQEFNTWEINKILSFHTRSNEDLAGYGYWFTPKSIEYITDWVTYF